MNVRSLVTAVDELYERAVTRPGDVDDGVLARWLEDQAAGLEPPVDREVARLLRRAARTARRLARVRSRRGGDVVDWRHGVDDALGSAGWRVQLDLARRGLDLHPDPELYEEARARYRAVHFTDWPVTYEEIVARHEG
ncbi:MAG: hypothetical protein R3290_04865 [Acidimicrobiia bacterium]|nr:hypothetical protein [Acidimicrobiia bacterium]